jgi:imidazole glycerol-phosphate synthase subunit HisF
MKQYPPDFRGWASAALIAGMVHYGDYTVEQIKRDVAAAGVPMRLDW